MNVDFKTMAAEVARLLDQKETEENTRGDGKIEGSIWAKYSGTNSADAISQADAEKVIVVDIATKGVRYIQGVLHSIGINWSPNDKSDAEKLENAINAKQDEYAKKHQKTKTSEEIQYTYNSKGEIVGTCHIIKNADGTVEMINMDKFGTITRKYVGYPDKERSEIITNYNKDGKETYKEICQDDGNYRTSKFFKDGALKLMVKSGEKESFVLDANGNPIKDKATLEAILDELEATESDRYRIMLYSGLDS